MLFASEEIVTWLNKIKPPYNINQLTQEVALKYLENIELVEEQTEEIIRERSKVTASLERFSFIKKVFPSDANFILARVDEANDLYDYLLSKGIVVRNRSSQALCENTLRFTIGTEKENDELINALSNYRK
jgi:histidinol-phosphate aminotransferase